MHVPEPLDVFCSGYVYVQVHEHVHVVECQALHRFPREEELNLSLLRKVVLGLSGTNSVLLKDGVDAVRCRSPCATIKGVAA